MSDSYSDVIIIDDSVSIGDYLKSWIEWDIGLSVEVFRSVEAAMSQIKNHPPRCLITDYDLGEGNMTGMELVRKLGQSSGICFPAESEIIFMSGTLDSDLVEEAESLGVAVCAEKPFSVIDTDRITRLLEEV